MEYQDYYKLLGVSRTDSADQIKRAYRKLAREYHPDKNKNKGAEEKFKQINEAYEVLKDPETRQRYDALGSHWKAGQEFRPPPGFDIFGGSGGLDGFSDFFGAIFGSQFGAEAGSAQQRSRSGTLNRRRPMAQYSEASLQVSIEELYQGASKSITLESRTPFSAPARKDYRVTIPPGTTEGSVIRMSGEELGGELRLKISVLPHAQFRVSGLNLVSDLPVSPSEAALGAKVKLQALDRELAVTVPAGSQSGDKLRLRGLGLPRTKSERGDLIVELKIVVPKVLSIKEREIYERLQKESAFDPRKSARA